MRASHMGLVLVGLATAGDAAAQTCGAPFTIDCNESFRVTPSDCTNHENSYTCGGGTYAGAEHVWEFTPPAGQRVYFDVWLPTNISFLGNNDLDLFLQTGTVCGPGGTCLDSETQPHDDHMTWIADGSTYRMSLDKKTSIFAGPCIEEYVVYLGCPEACDPVTDVQRVLTCSSDLVGEDSANGTDMMDYYACGDPYSNVLQTNNEMVYEFSPYQSGNVTFVLSNMLEDHDIYVLEDVCDEIGCIASSTREQTLTDDVTFFAEAGRTYYIVIEAFSGTSTYDLSFANGGGCAEDCDDGLDNDLDSLIDCADSDCSGDPVCCPDADGDGYEDAACGGDDCDDTRASVNPGAPEAACNGRDDDCDAGTPDAIDDDNDGVDECSDCDDSDPGRFPGNPEVCDGVDQDCDGTPDDGLPLTTWYHDGDGDGFGDPTDPEATCGGAPASHVASNTDCDDANAAVNPAAAEVTCDSVDNDCNVGTPDAPDGDGDGATVCVDCNDADPSIRPGAPEVACDGVDNDCDAGTVDDPDADGDGVDACVDCDDADPANFQGNTEVCDGADNDCDGAADDGLVFSSWYPDADGDGFGDGDGATVDTCDGPPAGTTADASDCDDTDPGVYPGATELPGDGLDQDCDGVDACHVDADGDGVGALGVLVGATLDCSAAGESPRSDDCDDADPDNFPGNAELCDGRDNDCDGQIDETSTFVDYWPDADGDGYGDPLGAVVSTCAAPPPAHVADDRDCDDANAAVHPGAPEATCNGMDDDCDPATPDAPDLDGDGDDACVDCDDTDPLLSWLDLDGDSYASCDLDCDDTDPARYPGAAELADGVDQDCDGDVDEGTIWTDDDGDGYAEAGGDCDDGDAGVNPSALEVCDGIDQDCDGDVDEGTECADDDGDGFTELDGDCNDADAAVNPGATEDLGNGLDDDCDGVTDDGARDQDADGWSPAAGDCDDTDATAHPGATEVCDGVDQDCDGEIDEDTPCSDDDGDGVSEDDGDCDDANDAVHPGAAETANGVDDDCDGQTDEGTAVSDDDGDGVSEVAGDCDDDDDGVHPGAPERDNGVDDDCDGEIDEGVGDEDGDGFRGDDGDCDDTSGWVHPGAPEVCDGLDNDCDGDIDEGCFEREVTPVDGGSCGCDSVPSPWTAWPAGLLLLGLRRRRA